MSGALNQGKKTLTVTDRESRGLQNPEDSLKHPEAKVSSAWNDSAWHARTGSAIMNFNFAAHLSNQPPRLSAQKLGEAQAALGKPGGAGGTPPKTS